MLVCEEPNTQSLSTITNFSVLQLQVTIPWSWFNYNDVQNTVVNIDKIDEHQL